MFDLDRTDQLVEMLALVVALGLFVWALTIDWRAALVAFVAGSVWTGTRWVIAKRDRERPKQRGVK